MQSFKNGMGVVRFLSFTHKSRKRLVCSIFFPPPASLVCNVTDDAANDTGYLGPKWQHSLSCLFVTFFFKKIIQTPIFDKQAKKPGEILLAACMYIYIFYSFPISRAGDASLCFRSPLKLPGMHAKEPNCDCMSLNKF